ncbi:MAG TPA: glycosyltransferase [Kofleriaceae bacterium]|jgi:glycosyltransferase involved in cell wall biosynthesis
MKARIVHVLSSFGMGGQERVAFDLAVSQLRAGCEVTVLSLAPPPDGPLAAELRAAGIEVARVARQREGIDPILILRLARWLRRHRVDLVHTHNRMALIYGAPAGRLARARVVHTKHGKNPRGGTRLAAGKLAARAVDAFVAVSDETADVARRRREIDERRLMVITNGIELGRFHPAPAGRERVRRELGIDAGAWVIGTVGRIAAEKNHALLVNAMAPLLGPGTRLIIAGDGPLLPALTELVAARGVASFVHLLGARYDVPDILNALDSFVLSSDTEGLPLVVLEAMATGLPVISTRVGGVPNVLEEGVTGFLVPAGDEQGLRDRAAQLRADPAATRALGERARSVAVSRYSAERMQRDYLELYARVLAPEPWYVVSKRDVRDRRSL